MYTVKSSAYALSNEDILAELTSEGLLNPRIDVATDEDGKTVPCIIAHSFTSNGPEFIIKLDDWLRRAPYDDEGHYLIARMPDGVEFRLMAGLWRAGFRPVMSKIKAAA